MVATFEHTLFEQSPLASAFGAHYLDNQEMDMESLDSILSILPVVRVKVESGIIHVSGFWARRLAADIHKNWGSARVSNNIFIELSVRTFSCHEFFALEVDYMLTHLIDKAKRVQTDKMTLESIRDAFREKTWLKDINKNEPLELNRSALSRLNVKPLQNQDEFLNTIAERTTAYNLRGQVLASPPGTGKTLAGYMTSLALDADCTLILSPPNAVEEVWVSTIEKNFKKTPKYWKSTSGKPPTGKEEFLICHYNYLPKLEDHMKVFRDKKRIVVWIDESHNFNEVTAKRTQFLIWLVNKIKPICTVWASGTPFKAMGSELVPILYTIDPLFTEDVKSAFVGIFGASRARAVDVLQHRIGKFTYRIDKKTIVDITTVPVENKITMPNSDPYLIENVRRDLREYIKDRVTYYKPLMPGFETTYKRLFTKAMALNSTSARGEPADTYQMYVKKLNKNFDISSDMPILHWCKKFEEEEIYPYLRNEDKKEYRYVISRHKTLLLVVRGEALGNVLGKRRIACFKAMVDYSRVEEFVRTARKKTLVFTSYVEVAKAIVERLESKGINTNLVVGETNHEFDAIIKDFKTNPRKQVVVATYKSLSTAVPVTEASDVFLMDPPFREYILDQATSRALRLGQDGPVRIITCVLDTGEDENLSSRNLDIMTWSKEMVDKMLGIKTAEVENVDY